MKTILTLFLLIPSLSWSLIFETDGFRCSGDDNGNNGISGLAYCEKGDTKYYGEMKENSFDGIVFVEAADNSISLVEFNNGKMNGLGIQIKDNRFVAGGQKDLIFFGWNVVVQDINSGDYVHEIFYLKNNKQIENNSPSKKSEQLVNYPYLMAFIGERGFLGRFFYFDEQGYCIDNTFGGYFHWPYDMGFDKRSGHLGKVNKNCKLNGPVIQFKNGEYEKFTITNNGEVESELSKEEFSALYGREFDRYNSVDLKLQQESLMEFLNKFLNFSLRVNNIGIQDFSSNYFLIGSQEKIYKKFDKYISEFHK